MARVNPYNIGLDKNAANYTPLSPLSLLARTAYVYPQRLAVIDGDWQLTWSEVYRRCRRLASALRQRGIGAGDTVATMLPNVPAMYEARHHRALPRASRAFQGAKAPRRTKAETQRILFNTFFTIPA